MNKILFQGGTVLLADSGCENCGEVYEKCKVIAYKDYLCDVKHPLALQRFDCRSCKMPLQVMEGKWIRFFFLDEAEQRYREYTKRNAFRSLRSQES